MRRKEIIVASGVFSVLVLGVMIAPAPSLAKGNCMAKLVGSAAVAPGFSCDVKFSDGSSVEECWFSFTPPMLSQFFDIFRESTSPSFEDDYGCACTTTGSFKSPTFNGSADEFECDDGKGDQLEGKIKGKKISGQGSDSQGNAIIFSCSPNTGCG